MKWKRKYLIIPVILLMINGCICFITGGYTKEVFTAFSTSPGFVFEDKTCFLVSYRLYKRPLGLRRFPDGGQTKRVYEALYLLKMKEVKIETASKIPDFMLSDTDIKYVRGKMDSGRLFLLITEIASGEYFQVDCSKRKAKIKQISPDEIVAGDYIEFPVTLSETKKLFKEQLRELDIPSPLEYVRKTKRQFVKDVVSLKGDYYYRAAVIDTLSDSEVSQLPEKISLYEDSLKTGKLEYSIYSEDTKEYIKKRIGL